MLIERKEKKIKEKKSKGLFYLIFTLTIIAALTISCKNKPTGTNEFAGFDENVTISGGSFTIDDFKSFKGRTIRSITQYGDYDGLYLWAEFDDNGIRYGSGSKDRPDNLAGTATLQTDAFKDSQKADFSNNDGSIQFELKDGKISSILVIIKGLHHTLEGSTVGTETPIPCQFVNR